MIMRKMKSMKTFLIVSVIFCSLSCAYSVSTQKTEGLYENSPTVNPNQEETNKKQKSNEKAKDYLNQGLKYKVNGEYEKAIEAFKKSIEAGNDDKEMYRRIADLYLSLKKYQDVETYLRKILENDPIDEMAHWALAKILVENLGKYEEGLKEAKISQELHGNKDSLSYVHDRIIGKAYDRLGDYRNAIKHYKFFLKRSSYNPDFKDFKEVKKRVKELEEIVKKPKS